MAKARHYRGFREERSTCRGRSPHRGPKICEIPLFLPLFLKNLSKPLKNLSKTSLLDPPNLTLFDPFLTLRTPGFWTVLGSLLTVLGVGFGGSGGSVLTVLTGFDPFLTSFDPFLAVLTVYPLGPQGIRPLFDGFDPFLTVLTPFWRF